MKYTLIGSREVPKHIETLQEGLGYALASKGIHGVSGAALGSDTNFLAGYCKYAIQHNRPLNFTSYIPWDYFKDSCVKELKRRGLWREDFDLHFVVVGNSVRATGIARGIHPNWDRCSKGAKALHARNVYQILGGGVDTAVDKVVCYAKEVNGEVKGGTRTAVVLAKQYDVPVSNLFNEETRLKAERWLGR